MSTSNHKVRESCLICEGRGRHEGQPCAYCEGTGIVYSRTGGALIHQGPFREVLVATGDCRVPLKKSLADAKNSKKWKLWFSIAVLFIGLAAFISFRVNYLRSHGEHVFWLAEFFSPVAVFSVLLVTFVDRLMDAPKKSRN